MSATITTQLYRVVQFVVLVSLFDIEFHELNWRIIRSIQSTQSGLYRVRRGSGECLSEVKMKHAYDDILYYIKSIVLAVVIACVSVLM